RNEIGAVVEALDAEGKPTTILSGKNGSYRVAEFINALQTESAYLGFEAYESTEGWSLAHNSIDALIVQGDAHSGYASLALTPDFTQALSKSLKLWDDQRVYVLSCWIKTPIRFTNDKGEATWSLRDKEGNILQSFPIKGTEGKWQHQNFAFQLDDCDGLLKEVSIVLKNEKQSESSVLLVDDILFHPLLSETSATVFDSTYGDKLATLNPSGLTVQTAYDSYRRAMTEAFNHKTQNVTDLFMSRQWVKSSHYFFPKSYPNTLTNITASNGGTLVQLVNGKDWKKEWASDNLEDWNTESGILSYSGTQASTISYLPSSAATDYGAKVSLIQTLDENGIPIPPQKPLGMAIGENLSVLWEPASGWQIRIGKSTFSIPSPIADSSGFGTNWLLIATKDPVSQKTAIFFMVDGLLLFSKLNSIAIEGAVHLSLGEPGFGFTSITSFVDPSLSATFLDGSGKELQKANFSGDGIIVQETLYDPVGRAAINTKATKIEEVAPLYQLDFAQSFNPETG
ncbi:MAG: hypothetical protein AAF705_22320, partial [Bacteroidota bacterium]